MHGRHGCPTVFGIERIEESITKGGYRDELVVNIIGAKQQTKRHT